MIKQEQRGDHGLLTAMDQDVLLNGHTIHHPVLCSLLSRARDRFGQQRLRLGLLVNTFQTAPSSVIALLLYLFPGKPGIKTNFTAKNGMNVNLIESV